MNVLGTESAEASLTVKVGGLYLCLYGRGPGNRTFAVEWRCMRIHPSFHHSSNASFVCARVCGAETGQALETCPAAAISAAVARGSKGGR